MKATIKYFGTLLTASMLFASCEGLLDRFPQDKLSPETFLANETEMQTYTNSYYTKSDLKTPSRSMKNRYIVTKAA